MKTYKTLSIAVASGRVGYVVLEDQKLIDWGMSSLAAQSPDEASRYSRKLLAIHDPELVVTEAINGHCSKGKNTIANILAVEDAAINSSKLNATVTKARAYQNKFEEAKALVKQFPELTPHSAQKPAIWLNEPRRMMIFEALSMALQVMHGEN